MCRMLSEEKPRTNEASPYEQQSAEWRAGYDEAEQVYHRKQDDLRRQLREAKAITIPPPRPSASSGAMARLFDEGVTDLAVHLLCEIAGGSWSETSVPPVAAALRRAYEQGHLDGAVEAREPRTTQAEPSTEQWVNVFMATMQSPVASDLPKNGGMRAWLAHAYEAGRAAWQRTTKPMVDGRVWLTLYKGEPHALHATEAEARWYREQSALFAGGAKPEDFSTTSATYPCPD